MHRNININKMIVQIFEQKKQIQQQFYADFSTVKIILNLQVVQQKIYNIPCCLACLIMMWYYVHTA